MTLKHFTAKVVTILRVQCGSPSRHIAFSTLPAQSILTVKKRDVETMWRDFFLTPSEWWDHRSEKINPRFPDFKHKQTRESLWLADSRNPPWVKAELDAIPPGILQAPNDFAWTQRLKTYVRAGQYMKTIEAFHQMQQERICPNSRTFLPVLNACAGLGALEEGKRIHMEILQVGCESNIFVGSCLVDMYAKCGSIKDAWNVFNKMPQRDVVTWSAMIGGFVKDGQALKAVELFWEMQQVGVDPDAVTFVGVLNACASIQALEEGRRVHEQIIRRGCESDIYVANCLIDMYAKCASIEDVWSVFRNMQEHDVVTWNTMIGGYAKCGKGVMAIELFQKMQQEVEPNTVTFVGVLNACATAEALEEGKRAHEQIIQRGWESDVYVGSCLVDMYAKCGSIEDAWRVFKKMSNHSVVTWSTLIGGYVKSGQGWKAIELYRKMQQEGVKPNAVTFVGVLNACASVGALEEGTRVHEKIIRTGCESDVHVCSSLVDMYAKSGSMEDARTIFNKMPTRDVVAWTTMIRGYAMHGHAKKAIGLFELMGEEGVEINGITLTCLLSACSHGGFIMEGLHYFNLMSPFFNILPTAEHYACMVDLLGRAGQLWEAEELTNRMPLADVCVWTSLLGACSIHGNIEIAERAAKRCWELDPENASGHVVLSNLYAAFETWDRSAAIG